VKEIVPGYGPTLPVRVSLNSQDFSASDVPFTYHEPLILTSIEPTYGLAGGGSRVVLSLAYSDPSDPLPFTFVGELEHVKCRFNRTVVPAIDATNTSVTCLSPAVVLEGGPVVVGVSVNGGIDFTLDNLVFIYMAETKALSISPLFGPTSGGTLVTITGFNIPLVPTTMAFCRFGSKIVQAASNGVGYINCLAPPVESPVSVSVEISLNGQDFSTFGLHFNYEKPIVVTYIEPAEGPIEGGTRISVRGGVFRNDSSDKLRCRFGDQDVQGIYHSESLIACTSPPLQPVDEIQTISVYSLAHVPEVQTVVIDAADYVPEEFTIETFSPTPMMPEIQRVSTWVPPVDEIQTISTGAR